MALSNVYRVILRVTDDGSAETVAKVSRNIEAIQSQSKAYNSDLNKNKRALRDVQKAERDLTTAITKRKKAMKDLGSVAGFGLKWGGIGAGVLGGGGLGLGIAGAGTGGLLAGGTLFGLAKSVQADAKHGDPVAKQAWDAMKSLKDELKTLENTLGHDFAPTLEKMTQTVQPLVAKLDMMAGPFVKAMDGPLLRFVGVLADQLPLWISPLEKALPALTNLASETFPDMTSAFSTLLSFVTAAGKDLGPDAMRDAAQLLKDFSRALRGLFPEMKWMMNAITNTVTALTDFKVAGVSGLTMLGGFVTAVIVANKAMKVYSAFQAIQGVFAQKKIRTSALEAAAALDKLAESAEAASVTGRDGLPANAVKDTSTAEKTAGDTGILATLARFAGLGDTAMDAAGPVGVVAAFLATAGKVGSDPKWGLGRDKHGVIHVVSQHSPGARAVSPGHIEQSQGAHPQSADDVKLARIQAMAAMFTKSDPNFQKQFLKQVGETFDKYMSQNPWANITLPDNHIYLDGKPIAKAVHKQNLKSDASRGTNAG